MYYAGTLPVVMNVCVVYFNICVDETTVTNWYGTGKHIMVEIIMCLSKGICFKSSISIHILR